MICKYGIFQLIYIPTRVRTASYVAAAFPMQPAISRPAWADLYRGFGVGCGHVKTKTVLCEILKNVSL